MRTRAEVIVVIDDNAVRIPERIWSLLMDCMGQMLNDGAHFDYYKGNETKATLRRVSEFYNRIC